MMSKVERSQKVGSAPIVSEVARSPTRAALAAAIDDFASAEKIADAARAAVKRAHEMVRVSRQRLDAASEGVTRAKEATAARAASAAASGAPLTPDRTTREARAAEQDAADEVDAAQAALATVEAARVDPELVERDAKKRVEAAAKLVLAEETEGAVAEVMRLKSELNDAIGRLTFIHSKIFAWPPTSEAAIIEKHFETFNFDRTGSNPTHIVWAAYFEALQSDPNASPPSSLTAA